MTRFVLLVGSKRARGLEHESTAVLLLGIFVFLPIAVNLFLIQHKESKRYLCGENNQLFGLVSSRDDQPTLNRKHCPVVFGPFAERSQ